MIEETVNKMLAGNDLALARLITLVEKADRHLPEVMRLVLPHTGRAHKIGITGPPGAGKSTLADRLISLLRKGGSRMAVLAVDPTSPFSGGAVLGDRVRMHRHYMDQGVYIRSMATRGALGGLSGVISEAIDIVGASGKDFILVETVGVGQSELDVFDYVDTVTVVLAPDSGDSIQAMKAGLLEIADIFVVNKSDLSGADRVRNNLRVMLESGKKRDGWEIPVVMCQAEQDAGIHDLLDSLLSHRQFLVESGQLEQKRARQRSGNFQRLLERKILSEIKAVMQGSGLRELEGKVQRGEIDPYTAVDDAIKSIILPARGKKKR